jgi:type IV pilus assembly protein PilN
MMRVNLLPWREEAKKARKMRFITLAVIVSIIAVFCIIIVDLWYRSLVSHQEDRNTFLTTQLGNEQTQLTALNKRKKELMAFDTAVHFIMSLREQSYRAVELVDTLARITPEAVSFTKIEFKGQDVILTGKAKSDSQISLFMDKLSGTKIFKQPDLTQIAAKENTTGDERIFQIKIQFQEPQI